VVALIVSILLFFPLPNNIFHIIFYIMAFCWSFLTVTSICLLIYFFKTKEAWQECIYGILLTGIFAALLHNNFYNIPFFIYNIISVIILVISMISCFLINARWKPEFLKYKTKSAPICFFIYVVFIIFIGSFILTVASLIGRTFSYGILMLFIGMAFSAVITFIFINKFNVSYLKLFGNYISLGLVGFALLPIEGMEGISFFILGIPASLTFWGIYLGNVAYNRHNARYISPLNILIGLISSAIGAILLNYFNEIPKALILILCSVSIGFIALYFAFSHYFFEDFMSLNHEEDIKTDVPNISEYRTTENIIEKPIDINNTFEQLTAREKEVAELILSGYTRGQIAASLYISLSTVKTHIKNIYSKLEINSKRELFILAETNKVKMK
jgi:DNA-binding CsgD family transcriptional regulator